MPEPSEIVVEPAELRLAAGSEAELAAQANDAAGQPIGGANIRFSSADAAVLKVTQHGLVTSLGPAAESAVIVASGRSVMRVPVEVYPGAPQRIEILAGDGQVLIAGEAPVSPVEVRTLDLAGNPVPGVALVLEPEKEQLAAQEAVTGADGRARIALAPVTVAGSLRVRIRERDTGAPTQVFQLTVQAGPPAAVAVACVARGTRQEGANRLDVQLRITDRHGNPVAGAALRARLTAGAGAETAFSTDPGGAARLQFPLPARARAPDLEVLAGEAMLARIPLTPGPEACPAG